MGRCRVSWSGFNMPSKPRNWKRKKSFQECKRILFIKLDQNFCRAVVAAIWRGTIWFTTKRPPPPHMWNDPGGPVPTATDWRILSTTPHACLCFHSQRRKLRFFFKVTAYITEKAACRLESIALLLNQNFMWIIRSSKEHLTICKSPNVHNFLVETEEPGFK